MKKYQIFITNNTSNGGLKSFSLSSRSLYICCAVLILGLLTLGLVTFDYSMAVFRHEQARELRVENTELRRHLDAIKSKVHLLESNVSKVENFALKLRVITDREHALNGNPIGPLPLSSQPSLFHGHPDLNDFPVDQEMQGSIKTIQSQPKKKSYNVKERNQWFENRLSYLLKKVNLVQKDIWLAIGSVEEQKHLLRVTPNTLPVQGRVTSRFGYRGDAALPFFLNTDVITDSIAHFHRGIDIAAPIGTSVYAPADGVVVGTGYDSMTGNYIYINHGYELDTLYAHLDEVKVDSFTVIKRGTVIGTVGNTGRSTGPHLHYEVRIKGQPVDPEYFSFGF